ncbi:hypothetical protein [Burkholderia thailandensis]|uniref:hypothetical protein n=1 Tax=Burkholderia thailandensis TaxID=57975 RepID=UPI0012FDEEC0|nr:hypothetical protein [Burkholderia thailandensis]
MQGAYGDRGWEISPPNIDWPGGAIEAGGNGETIIKIIFLIEKIGWFGKSASLK